MTATGGGEYWLEQTIGLTKHLEVREWDAHRGLRKALTYSWEPRRVSTCIGLCVYPGLCMWPEKQQQQQMRIP